MDCGVVSQVMCVCVLSLCSLCSSVTNVYSQVTRHVCLYVFSLCYCVTDAMSGHKTYVDMFSNLSSMFVLLVFFYKLRHKFHS